jgi:outer membrane protein assembly factor BamB
MKWYIETGGAIESSAAIDEEGTIYIASTDGKLYAIGEKLELYP